jgi:uncharacterized membrane protein
VTLNSINCQFVSVSSSYILSRFISERLGETKLPINLGTSHEGLIVIVCSVVCISFNVVLIEGEHKSDVKKGGGKKGDKKPEKPSTAKSKPGDKKVVKHA